MIAQFMQRNLVQRFLANLLVVGASVGGSVEQSVDVALDGNDLESLQRQTEIVALAQGIWISAFAALALLWVDESFRKGCSIPCALDAPRSSSLVCSPLHSCLTYRWQSPVARSLVSSAVGEKTLCRLRVPMSLQQDIQHIPFGIHCLPQIVLLFLYRHHYFTLDAIYPGCRDVCVEADLRIAVRTFGTIPESTRMLPQFHDTASFSQDLGSSRERCNKARRSSWWFRRENDDENTSIEGGESSRRTTILLLCS